MRNLVREVVSLGLAVATCAPGCSRRSEDGTAPVASATVTTPAVSTPTADPLSKCLGCANTTSPSWFFNGLYKDAKCKQPVASADFAACQIVSVPQTARVMFTETVGSHKANELSEVVLSQALDPSEAGTLFKRSETGACTAIKTSFKLVPTGCEGKRVCRGAARDLACSACAELPNGCPNFEGARLHVAITP